MLGMELWHDFDAFCNVFLNQFLLHTGFHCMKENITVAIVVKYFATNAAASSLKYRVYAFSSQFAYASRAMQLYGKIHSIHNKLMNKLI